MYSHWVPLGKEGEGIKKPEELLIHTETVGLQSLHTQEQQLQVVLAARMHACTQIQLDFNPLHQDMPIHAGESRRWMTYP